MTVVQLLATMTNAEFVGWQHHYRKHGFPADRIAGTVARGASAICGSWGSSVSAKDIIPTFGPAARSFAPMLAYVRSVPGAVVTSWPRTTPSPRAA